MEDANAKIIKQLKQSAAKGLTYYQAKQKLLKQGFSEQAIELASAEYQYGSQPKAPDPATAAFAKDPADAALVGQAMLKDEKRLRTEQAIVDGVAGEYAPDLQSDLKYQYKFAYDIGMSWWTWLVIEAAIAGTIVYFKLPLYLYSIVVAIFVVVLAIKRA